jgi:hypothetical protein
MSDCTGDRPSDDPLARESDLTILDSVARATRNVQMHASVRNRSTRAGRGARDGEEDQRREERHALRARGKGGGGGIAGAEPIVVSPWRVPPDGMISP